MEVFGYPAQSHAWQSFTAKQWCRWKVYSPYVHFGILNHREPQTGNSKTHENLGFQKSTHVSYPAFKNSRNSTLFKFEHKWGYVSR